MAKFIDKRKIKFKIKFKDPVKVSQENNSNKNFDSLILKFWDTQPFMVPRIKEKGLQVPVNIKRTFVAFKVEFQPQVIENNTLEATTNIILVQKTIIQNAVRAN
jgi:hypothetical protein